MSITFVQLDSEGLHCDTLHIFWDRSQFIFFFFSEREEKKNHSTIILYCNNRIAFAQAGSLKDIYRCVNEFVKQNNTWSHPNFS